MSLRPFRDIKRKKTKVVKVGNVLIGGDNPITVQSMTNTLTKDIKATLKQINEIANEGADLVRVSCPDKESSLALKEITVLSLIITSSFVLGFLPILLFLFFRVNVPKL